MRIAPLLLLCACATAAQAAKPSAPESITLDVDASEAPRRIIHARLSLRSRGPLSLVYPKWIPGEHGPTGPIEDLAGITIKSGGKTIPWRRDPVDLYRISADVTGEVEVTLDYLSPPPGHGQFTSGASITQNLAILNWHTFVLVPAGAPAREVTVRASLKVPRGWKTGTALKGARDGDRVQFEPVTLETLVDSPVLTGAWMTEVPLGDNHGAPVFLDVAAETPDELQLAPQAKAHFTQLVREEAALYGARHFNDYHFLLALTDSIPANGIEHHQSSDNREAGRSLVDPDLERHNVVHLLAHESTHSWNGKYRRPADLATPDYQTPMQGDLLWVYEGLTQYLGTILTARAGAWDAQMLRDYFADVAATMQSRTGRVWRPLQDTATAAQILYGSRADWGSWRRSVDYYPEGDLIWLEVDARLREASGGKISIDDFVKRFHGGQDTGPQVVTYRFDDVVRTLHELAPAVDFATLLRTRLDSTAPEAPLEGLARAGFRLVFNEEESAFQKMREKSGKVLDLRDSIGLIVDTERESIVDVIAGRPADKAGVMPGARLVAVNGRRFTPERLVTAVSQTKSGEKLQLLVENAETFTSFGVDYAGGLRYPHLVAVEGKPDLLGEIGAARAR